MGALTQTITVAFDMSKAFATINIHTLIQKLIQTKIPGTIIKFIANYTNGRKAYTIYRNHSSSQRQLKTGVLQGGVFSRTLFNIYTANILPPRAPVQVMSYTDDITITSTNTSTSAANKYNQTYIQFLGLTLDPNVTYSTHIPNISVHAHKPLQIIKNTLTETSRIQRTFIRQHKHVDKHLNKMRSINCT